ncbi:NmrA family transcriptional regulator [Aspergillus heteromorphus CBS 117.55]|uniref:NmrA family transcriptional regulator n=1 Tax=Aspergillus heteromorphus CBS 117.55 TaxID=1448321 RepID=A0A317WYY9_9EURO|nr:NmrA family transcriptional regulator [Aspergillus heteromorphus CBS 117.55]PWY89948.1 NmrA family transcriptional regulator [Aspergillus heteromorphus CBS 117.55]
MVPSKILVVFGSTGNQGGSVIDYVLKDPSLSQEFSIRAVTRDVSASAAAALTSRGVEVVQADADDLESLAHATQGANTTFIMTPSSFAGEDAEAIELARGKAMADAAVSGGSKYIIFSTLPDVIKASGGKYTKATNFNAKAQIEQYIRGLPVKSIFYAPGWFMQNCAHVWGPRRMADNSLALLDIVSPGTRFPLIDVQADTGKFLAPVLAQPEAFAGQTLSLASEIRTYREVVEIMSKVRGETVHYRQVSADEVFGSQCPPLIVERMGAMMRFYEEYPVFGPDMDRLVAQSVAMAGGRLTTFEEFLTRLQESA